MPKVKKVTRITAWRADDPKMTMLDFEDDKNFTKKEVFSPSLVKKNVVMMSPV